MSELNWNITPADFLREIGFGFKKRGKWLQLENCIFCDGAHDGDSFSLNLHSTDGNFFCHREKSCGQRGSFWKFIEANHRDPKDFLNKRDSKKTTRKRYIFGK